VPSSSILLATFEGKLVVKLIGKFIFETDRNIFDFQDTRSVNAIEPEIREIFTLTF
jgi:hypothetical protein